MVDKYAVLGNPIAHSRSPQIHAAFAAQTGEEIDYRRILVPAGQFATTARQFIAAGGKGINVTVPCKEDAYRFADELTRRADRAGAVNTMLINEDGTVLGDNTDGEGLIKDITGNLKWPIRHKRILLLGAGGAVRGVLAPVLALEPAIVLLVNRTGDKAVALAEEFSDLGKISGGGYDLLMAETPFDLIINATSAGLTGELPPVSAAIIGAQCCCYDLMYTSGETIFLRWAKDHGVGSLADGIGMLVEQAAESFALWRGKSPDTQSVIKAIHAEIAAEDRK